VGRSAKPLESRGVSEVFTPYSRPFHALLPLYLVGPLREGHVDHKMLGVVLRSKVNIYNPLVIQALGLLKTWIGFH